MKVKMTTTEVIRFQSGVLPYRYNSDGDLEIMLISTTHENNWGFPKGGLEPGLRRKENAAKEAFEEAGIKGKVGKILGLYEYIKGSTQMKQQVFLYPMEVTQELKTWPEAHRRIRKWFTPEEAKLNLSRDKALAKFVKQLVKSL